MVKKDGGIEGEWVIEFYLTPAAPGCGHMAAGAAEVHLWSQHVALSTRRISI